VSTEARTVRLPACRCRGRGEAPHQGRLWSLRRFRWSERRDPFRPTDPRKTVSVSRCSRRPWIAMSPRRASMTRRPADASGWICVRRTV